MSEQSEYKEEEIGDLVTKYYETYLDRWKKIRDNGYFDEVSMKIDKSVYQDSCVICINDFKRNETILKLHCNHIFHENCIEEWLQIKMECPICRKIINYKLWQWLFFVR